MDARFYQGAGPYRGRFVHYEGFDFNHAGIARCAVGPELRSAITAITGNALEFAQLIAPDDSGEYQAGFRSGVHEIPDMPFRVVDLPERHMARWAGYVQNVSRDAIIVEVGAKATRRYAILRRTLEWLEAVAED
jgi:hypothetical protein